MYGILLESVQQLLRDRYGDEAWRRILIEAGLSPHCVFEVLDTVASFLTVTIVCDIV